MNDAKKYTWEEYQELLEKIKQAAVKDLYEMNSETSVLKVETKCRDEEDEFDLYCYYDFSPYKVGLYKRFHPDVEDFIMKEYEVLKRWHDPNNYTEKEAKQFQKDIYSAEGINKKYYVRVTKYAEISGKMIILYSVDFSLRKEVILVDDLTGYYQGFDYEEAGYQLSEAERFLSDSMQLLRKPPSQELSYSIGEILYIDGSLYECPFHAVFCGDYYLYIQGAEKQEIIKKVW